MALALSFPLSAAIHRKLVTIIGHIPIPPALVPFPIMRGSRGAAGWGLIRFANGTWQLLGPATDPSIPIRQIVNDTRLKEMIVSGWEPQDVW